MCYSFKSFWEHTLVRLTAFRVWIVAFVYALSVGLLIQFVVLPVLFPSFHAGHGLLAGNDVSTFHNLAVKLAQRIRVDGWSVWSLSPSDQATVGVMAAAYVFLPEEPWVVLPLYAAFFAIAAACLFAILRLCGFEVRAAGIGVSPLLLMPSSALLYAIPHKDVFFVCGNMMFLYSIVRLAVAPGVEGDKKWLYRAGIFFWIGLFGAFLVWLVRPYGLEIMMGIGGFIALVSLVAALIGIFRHRRYPVRRVICLAVLCSVIVLLKPLGDSGFAVIVPSGLNVVPLATIMPEIVVHTDPETGKVLQKVADAGWVSSGVLSPRLETLLQRLADTRNEYLFWHASAASTIDSSVSFLRVWDMVRYLPRALQIGLFSPFPKDWLGVGSLPANTFMRRIASIEMALWYCFFPFCLMAVIKGRKHLVVGVVFLYVIPTILVLALVIPNIGTLYRMRFGFWIVLFSLGVSMAVSLLGKRRITCVG